MMLPAAQPSAAVCRAFGVQGVSLQRFPGGRGRTWRAGSIVLRHSGDIEEAVWKAEVLAGLPQDPRFRTARPIPDADGIWVRDGWEAWQWLEGETDESRVAEVIHAGNAFHQAVSAVECPAFISRSDDACSQADRMVWDETGATAQPHGQLLDPLAAAFLPVTSPAQLIHGDLLGNVLFAPRLAPAIIDWAPYWRPGALGAAIAMVDAVCWHGWPINGLTDGDPGPEWEQLLARALAFCITTFHLLGGWNDRLHQLHAPVVDAVLSLLR